MEAISSGCNKEGLTEVHLILELAVLSVIIPHQSSREDRVNLVQFTLEPDYEIVDGSRVEMEGCSYVRAANIAAAAAGGDELLFLPSGFRIATAQFRQAGGFNEHFMESCHEADLCRRINLPAPPAGQARNQLDELLLADRWPAE
jgi:hypothetical protein